MNIDELSAEMRAKWARGDELSETERSFLHVSTELRRRETDPRHDGKGDDRLQRELRELAEQLGGSADVRE